MRTTMLATSYGIEIGPPHPPDDCFRRDVAARRFDVSVNQLKEYAREGLLISLKSRRGIPYYTDRDSRWASALKRLQEEAHLSCDGIRQLLVSRCTCWKFRHCEFHGKAECPVTTDPSKPCWVNRAKWSVLVSHPCYSCIVYRSAPECEALRAALDVPASVTPQTVDDNRSQA
ncbi:MAG: helix-turn-helix domain-containing protein [Terriglobales bacterium]|jgi:hypothetical protein